MRLLFLSIAGTLAACGDPSADPKADATVAGDTAAKGGAWFQHTEDNSKFIERYNALHDSLGAPKDTAVIYTDTWSGEAKYDITDTTLADSAQPE